MQHSLEGLDECNNINKTGKKSVFCRRGSYNLEKVLSFSSRLVRLEKSLNSAKVLEKYLISLLGLEKSLKFTTLSTPDTSFLQN